MPKTLFGKVSVYLDGKPLAINTDAYLSTEKTLFDVDVLEKRWDPKYISTGGPIDITKFTSTLTLRACQDALLQHERVPKGGGNSRQRRKRRRAELRRRGWLV